MSTPGRPVQDLSWLITNFVERVPDVAHAVVVSSDGLPLAFSAGFPQERADQLAAVTSGLTSLTQGASRVFEGGAVVQTVVEMQRGVLVIMAISNGASLAVLAASTCDLGLVAYEMTLLVERAGRVLTPADARRRHAGRDAGRRAAMMTQSVPALGDVVAGLGRGGDDRGSPAWQGPGRTGPWDEPQPQRQPYPPAQQQQFPAEEESGSTRLVRPYTVTGGRTQPRYKLALEALVSATVYEPRDLSVLAPECQAILQFCLDWRSVAEISAVLRMPLGVARILVADMSADGLVRIHQRDDSEGRPDLNLLERVLSGLRKI